jgi:hypothetical protein
MKKPDSGESREKDLEKQLGSAIDIVLKRDSALKAAERRIVLLEELLDKHGIAYPEEELP